MQREIKFRAWDKRTKQMVEVRELTFSVDGIPYCVLAWEADAKEKSSAYLITLAPETFELMQFTGLTDKNGKEIYEGDVVRVTSYTRLIEANGIFKVEFKVPFFCLTNETGDEYGFSTEATEVIGNIYENPELLELPKPCKPAQ